MHTITTPTLIKFVDDTTVVGLISNNDETNYRSELRRLAGCCSDINLSRNVEKTKEIVVDYRRALTQHTPLTINGANVERVSSTKFLGVHITEDLSWTDNTAALAKRITAASLLPPQTEKSQSPDPHHVHLLQRHHREHSNKLHHCVPAAIWEETAEPTGQDQQVEGQLHPSGCQEAELAPELAPPSLFGLSLFTCRHHMDQNSAGFRKPQCLQHHRDIRGTLSITAAHRNRNRSLIRDLDPNTAGIRTRDVKPAPSPPCAAAPAAGKTAEPAPETDLRVWRRSAGGGGGGGTLRKTATRSQARAPAVPSTGLWCVVCSNPAGTPAPTPPLPDPSPTRAGRLYEEVPSGPGAVRVGQQREQQLSPSTVLGTARGDLHTNAVGHKRSPQNSSPPPGYPSLSVPLSVSLRSSAALSAVSSSLSLPGAAGDTQEEEASSCPKPDTGFRFQNKTQLESCESLRLRFSILSILCN
ncbi:hypothetical protein Q8A73_020774 [Channa argus]|nr:hypothetical protein Q8A73_020774 [Channa argus]